MEEDKPKPKCKYGVIYFSYIPEGLNVKILRDIMSEFGEVGRVYLESEDNKKKHRTYSEGWVEFKKKRVAKLVAKTLHGTTLQYGRKHSILNGQMWSIKYLHRFKWNHLTEKLAHDRAVSEQKKRSEMSQAKKQVDFYQRMTEQSKKWKKNPDQFQPATRKAKHIETHQKRPTSQGSEMAVSVDDDLLSSIFKKVE